MKRDGKPRRSGFLYERSWREEANSRGENHWYEYGREIGEQMGLDGEEVELASLTPKGLDEYGCLVLPARDAGEWPAAARKALAEWVNEGGVLIGFATRGLDDLFGVSAEGRREPPGGDPYAVSARLRLAEHEWTEDIRSRWRPDQPLLAFGTVRELQADDADVLAELVDGGIAITARQVGKGWACLFAFDLAQTMWALQQGRPITEDFDGDGYLRSSDAMVTRGNEMAVLYSDELLFVLRNMVAQGGQPLKYQMPPSEEGRVPEALFHWGGDDEGMPEAQLFSSEFMKQRGLPYHVNAMPDPEGKFALSKDEYDQIRANGHEVSLHYDFISDREPPCAFNEEDIRRQMAWYLDAFGEAPICTVFHWTLWTGGPEPARWMLAAGNRADNSRVHHPSPPLNPAGLLGFAFGTSYPFHVYEDAEHGNEQIPFLIEPITAYEMGYKAGEGTDFEPLREALEMARHYRLCMDMFYHPVTVFRYEECRAAVDEALRVIAETGLTAVHMGNDELCEWWEARQRAAIGEVVHDAEALSMRVTCDHPAGMVVMAPTGGREVRGVSVNAGAAEHLVRNELGGEWVYVVCPPGESEVEIRF